jgi:hypothetical protein
MRYSQVAKNFTNALALWYCDTDYIHGQFASKLCMGLQKTFDLLDREHLSNSILFFNTQIIFVNDV